MDIQKQVVGQLKLIENVVVDVDIDTLSSMTEFTYEITQPTYDQMQAFQAIEVSFKALFELGTENGRKNAYFTGFDMHTRTTYLTAYENIQFVATDNVVDPEQITDDKIIGITEKMTIPATPNIAVHVQFIEPIRMDRTDVCRMYMRNSEGQYITFGAQSRKDPFFNAMTKPFGRAIIINNVAQLPRMKAYMQTQSSQTLQQLISTKTINEVRERLNYLESLHS